MASEEAPNAVRVDLKTYYAGKQIEDRGVAYDRFCPVCQASQTIHIFYASSRTGKTELGLQCNACRTTWCANDAMGYKLQLSPSDRSDIDRGALRDF